MQTTIDALMTGQGISSEQSQQFFQAVLKGEVEPALLAGVLVALKLKGETIEEITGAASAIRQAAADFPKREYPVTDIVGTGGDGHHTINISTTAAIVAASMGVKVAKHGNRSVSSKSGSSDLLAASGVNLTMSAETAKDCLDKTNLAFLFAPHYHGGFKHAGPVRAALKTRTIFNIMGPLVNPASPEYMVLGVYTPDYLEPIAQTLKALGTQRAMVVHGAGLDEVAIHGTTEVIELNNGDISRYQLNPADFGVDEASLEDIKGGDPQQNLEISKAILTGTATAAQQNAVAVNAACALYINGLEPDLKTATAKVLAHLKSGQALKTLEAFAECSHG
ncbi:anthranilate phosphoribosyltransferase [Paraferrimonas sp. SM1919]|uniref:anthranilate phosphoribosyltransferase n=1 Tax=Paraferrimonas sp. SM1919 TaxID=2662263 RepID=UPI0013D604D5|nr:anthranilate phosphoribosyltransferase [Paraferrimonas sp. SM1919]